MTSTVRVVAAAVAGVLVFLILATANSGGYRYGISDQAFYIPAIEQHLDPQLFPRDSSLLAAQSTLMASDDVIAFVARRVRLSLPTIAVVLYVATLALLLLAAAAFGRALGYSWWAVAILGVVLTFRHRIAKTGANTLEGYMHTRQLAFGIGVAALACVLRGRHGVAVTLVAIAGVVHPTTALWFGIVVGVAAFVSQPRWRTTFFWAGMFGLAVVLWQLASGLTDRLTIMDPEWLQVLDSKDYLFPAEWPVNAWLLNLAYPVVIALVLRARVARGMAVPNEGGLMIGLLVLFAVFVISVPLTMRHVALAVQLQVTRVFWVLDFVALAGVAWWLSQSPKVARVALVVLLAGSCARGYYLLEIDQPERRLVTVDLPNTPWVDAMRWLRTQPVHWHVLADPGHAWKYGSSLRVAAARDTVIEGVKDSALALYNREVATRVGDRSTATADFDRLTTARVLQLDLLYRLDVIVVEAAHTLDLPLLYRNAGFAIYDVR